MIVTFQELVPNAGIMKSGMTNHPILVLIVRDSIKICLKRKGLRNHDKKFGNE